MHLDVPGGRPVIIRPLWLRSASSRPLSVFSLVALSAMVAAVAMLGPLLVRALDQFALASAISGAPASQQTISVFAQATTSSDVDDVRAAVGQPFAAADVSDDRLFTPLRLTASSFSNLNWSGGASSSRTASRVTAAESGCAGITVVSGRCPTADDQTLVAVSDADRRRLGTGDEIGFRLPKSSVRSLVVVGTYDPDRSLAGVLIRPGSAEATVNGITGEPLIVTPDRLAAMRVPLTVTADVTVRPELRLTDEATVRSVLARVEAVAKIGIAGQQLFFGSLVGPLLDSVDRNAHNAAVLVDLVGVQAVAVALFALVIVLQRVASARTVEWTLGRLRGLPRLRWLRSVYLEPALALVVGVPLGALASWWLARIVVDTTLGPDVALEPTRWPVLAAGLGAGVAAVLALVVVSLPGLRRPPIEVVQQSAEGRRLPVAVLLAEVIVVVFAATSLYQLVTQDDLTVGRSRLGLLAPALLAIALGVIAVRLLIVIVRASTKRPPRSRTALIATRRAARMPSSLNPAMVIAAGLALAVFASQVLLLSERNLALRADALVGAPVVLDVTRPKTLDLRTAVDQADPSGHYAMAVQEKAASSDGGTSRIVAVDATRFDSISSWRPRWAGIGPLRDRLRAGLSDPIVLVGTSVTVDLSDVSIRPEALPEDGGQGGDPANAPVPSLDLTVQTDHGWRSVTLGELTPGSHRYTAALKFSLVDNQPLVDACVRGCRLVNFLVAPDPNLAFTIDYRVRSISTDTQPAAQANAWFTRPGWHERSEFRSAAQAIPADVSASSAGLRVQSSTGGFGDQSVVVPGDTSERRPVVLGTTTVAQPAQDGSTALTGTGLDGQTQLIDVLAHGTLPRALNDGVLTDLSDIAGLSDSWENEATSEVWMTADAPSSVRDGLQRAGLTITGEENLAQVTENSVGQPITLGARVGVVLGLVATVLSLLTLALARSADVSRNRAVWRALSEAGQSRRTVRGLVAVEVAVPAVVGVVVGCGAGAIAIALARGRIPLLADDPVGPPFDLSLTWTPILVVAALSAVVIMVVAAVAAVVEARAAGSER